MSIAIRWIDDNGCVYTFCSDPNLNVDKAVRIIDQVCSKWQNYKGYRLDR
jgi:hypothetical protein